MTQAQRALLDDLDRRYQQYVAPLEQRHSGEYAAVSADGRVALAKSRLEAVEKAVADLGPGAFTFKVGASAVGKWLSRTQV